MRDVVCIRKCVSGRWSVESRCMADGGGALDVVGRMEVPRCVCVWSCCWARMQLVAGLVVCERVCQGSCVRKPD